MHKEQIKEQISRLDFLNNYLLKENPPLADLDLYVNDDSFAGKMKLFRALCNIRKPQAVSEAFLATQNAFLQTWNESRQLTSLADLTEVGKQLYVWQGDITSLAVDGIVNAANSDMLGCMQANHNCIDNIIHTRAGVQLRLACHDIMQEQNRKEAVGKAKITDAYNLPATYILHTVGPYVDERGVSPLKAQLLASSYRSCLTLADQYGLDSLAFCCISTGVFNFPQEAAAEIAIQTVKEYVTEKQSSLHIIFNVFENTDLHIYQSLLQGKE